MHIRLSFALALGLFLGLGIRPAQAQLGFGVGLNFDSVQDIEFADNQDANLENATGYHIGIFYDTGFGPLAIRPGIFYRQANNLGYDDGTFNAPELPDEFDLTMLEVPVDVRFRVLPLPLIKPYVLAAPVFSFPSTDEDELDEAFEDFYVSAAVGAGLEVSLPVVGVRVMPELRYAFGVSRFIKEDAQIGGRDIEAAPTTNSFQVRLNVAL